jgi:hypothetical protein
VKCPTCGQECEDAQPASLGSQKPVGQQLYEFEQLIRLWDPIVKDLQDKELAKKTEGGHNTHSLPPRKGQ